MKVLLIGDFHGRIPEIKERDFDFILCTGDLNLNDEIRDIVFKHWNEIKSGRELEDILKKERYIKLYKRSVNSADRILNFLNSFNTPVFLVYGNADFPLNQAKKIKYFKAESLNKKVKKYKNIKLLTNKIIYYKNIEIIGFSGYRGAKIKFPKTKEDKKLADAKNSFWKKRLKRLFSNFNKNDFSIFLTHDAPRGYLDKVDYPESPMHGKHVGDEFILEYIEKYQPDLMVCGHMHEHQKTVKIKKTLLINPGAAMNGEYAVLEGKKVVFKKVKKFLIRFNGLD